MEFDWFGVKEEFLAEKVNANDFDNTVGVVPLCHRNSMWWRWMEEQEEKVKGHSNTPA